MASRELELDTALDGSSSDVRDIGSEWTCVSFNVSFSMKVSHACAGKRASLAKDDLSMLTSYVALHQALWRVSR